MGNEFKYLYLGGCQMEEAEEESYIQPRTAINQDKRIQEMFEKLAIVEEEEEEEEYYD